MYDASITYKIGSENEYGYDQRFPTLREAADWLIHMASGHGGMVAAWINNRRVILQGGGIFDRDGGPLCTNEAWHAIFAPEDKRIKPLTPVEEVMGAQLSVAHPRRPH